MATQQEQSQRSLVAMERLQQRYPAETGALMALLRNEDSESALDERDKELINVALAIASPGRVF